MMLNPDRFVHTARDTWRWAPALPADVQAIVDLVFTEYAQDAQHIWPVDPVEGGRNLMHAIVNQMYNPTTEFVTVCRRISDDKIIAFTWAKRDQRQVFSREEMIAPQFASIDLSLPARSRVALVFQMMRLWEKWAEVCEVKMIASSNIRADWENLMYLHSCAGYLVRGTLAWKRLSMKTLKVDGMVDPHSVVAHSTYSKPAGGYYYNDPQPTIIAVGSAPEMKIYQGKNDASN
jgi:hypothetical protein